MARRPLISLIVPTRCRPDQLRRFLDSIAATAYHPEQIEVILVIDHDDPVTLTVAQPRLSLRHVVGPPRRTMGELNRAGYAVSTGDFVMLLNDDVIVRTCGWDAVVRECIHRFPDPFVLIHVNDTLIRQHLCVFPLVSREFCELAGGICPAEYRRYRIDDHIEDVFNILAALGVKRTVHLPDVVFEHANAVEHPTAGRVYQSDPTILAHDAPIFDALFPARKELAVKLINAIEAGSDPWETAQRRKMLEAMTDPFALRTPGRQLVVRSSWRRRMGEFTEPLAKFLLRGRECIQRKGWAGLARAAHRRLMRRTV